MSTGNTEVPENTPCIQCGNVLALDGRFCPKCGTKRPVAEIDLFQNKWTLLKQGGLFFAIDVSICCLVKFVAAFDTFRWFLSLDILMAIITIVFFAINWNENKGLLIWKSFSWQKLAAYGAIAISASCFVHYTVGWLNIALYSKDEHYFEFVKGHFFAELLIVSLVAVMPAVFEELGYRGYLLQNLLKVADKEQAIYISSFLFAIIHMSFISLFWLIPFALFLGFVRIRENTLWYGIFIHFCFNLTACLFDFM